MPCLRRCSTAAIHSMPCINHQVFYPQAMGNSLSPPPAHETRQKACERAPEFGSAHRRRCTEFGAPAPTRARVFRSGWPRWSPRTESPVLAHLRPHCCTPSLLLPQIGCAQVQHTLLTRRTGAPANARLPRFRRPRIPHPCAESELAASRNRAPRAPPHPAPPRAAGNGAPPVHLMRLGKSHAS